MSAQLKRALRRALLCIEDEVNIYAAEMCDAKRVAQARKRHAEGGTLYYYATVIAECRKALRRERG